MSKPEEHGKASKQAVRYAALQAIGIKVPHEAKSPPPDMARLCGLMAATGTLTRGDVL